MTDVKIIKQKTRGRKIMQMQHVVSNITEVVTKYVSQSSTFGSLSFSDAFKNYKPPKFVQQNVIKQVSTWENVERHISIDNAPIRPVSVNLVDNQTYVRTDNNLLSPLMLLVEGLVPMISTQLPKIHVNSKVSMYSRLIREINDVNDNFFNLRTVIVPDPEEHCDTLYYLMLPNDGALCHLPLLGRIKIPSNYPNDPPIFHMLTQTGRSNVDIFHHYAVTNLPYTSMCFDIFKYGSWQSTYTLSTIVGSLLDAVVSYQVPQMYGGQVAEFVTMEKLQDSYQNVIKCIQTYRKYVPNLPLIPGVLSQSLNHLVYPLRFPDEIEISSPNEQFNQLVISKPFYLQGRSTRVVGFDLSELTDNYVCSFVITNNTYDLEGRKPETILFRNGVTATAGRKTLKNPEMTWYYHGKPLNVGQVKFALTMSPNQITCSYQDQMTGNRWFVHGDCALSRLESEIVGDLSGQKFYLVLYFKRKWGHNSLIIRNLGLTQGLIQSLD